MDPAARAQLYAMLHRGHPGDVAFYRRVCEGAKDVLELGAGYGRVALPLARAGHQVLGLDIDEPLLSMAREAASSEAGEVQRRLSWVRADMTDPSLGRTFDRVLIPYNAICCLLSAEAVSSCLRQVSHHLASRGRLALDCYHADPLHALGEGDDEDFEPVVAFEHGGDTLEVFERSCWEPASQRLDTSYRFFSQDGSQLYEHTIEQRYLLAPELDALLAEAGYRVVERAGGFHGEPLDDEAEQLVIVAEQAHCSKQ